MSRLSDDEIDAMESNARRALDKRYNSAAEDVIELVAEIRLLRGERSALARAVDAQRFIAEAVAYRAREVQNEIAYARADRSRADELSCKLWNELQEKAK